MTQIHPLHWYPGHCYLETALFGRDSTDSTCKLRLIKHIVHKRNIPSDAEHEKIGFPFTGLHTSTDPIPAGSLQLIRFVGLARNAPELADTHQDRQVLASVFSTLGFHLEHVAFALNSSRAEHGRMFVGDETDIGSNNPAFYMTGSRLCLIWRFDTDTKSTRVVVVNFTPPTLQMVVAFTHGLEAAMQPYNQCFGHPMFIVLPLAYYLRLDTISMFDQDSNILRAIETQITLKSANRIATLQQLRDLGRLCGTDRFVLNVIKSVLEQARLFNARTFADKEGNFQNQIAKHFLAHLDLQRDLIQLDISFLENMRENVAHQQGAISTIVNMQDSTSMKTIAVITMVFLPGTFLASMFAMPVFPQGPNDTFWLYWAICVPLTVLVFLAWLAWFYWHTVSKEKENAQDSFSNTVNTWWDNLIGANVSQAKDDTQDYVRVRLAGDNHKEWIDRFHSAKTE